MGGHSDQTAKQIRSFWRKDQRIGNFGVADSSHCGTFVLVFNTDRAQPPCRVPYRYADDNRGYGTFHSGRGDLDDGHR